MSTLFTQTIPRSIASTKRPSETCSTDVSIDASAMEYMHIFPNAISIPLNASIIQHLVSPFPDGPATSHKRCYNSWQRVGNAFWELTNALHHRTHVGAWGAETKSDPRRPVDVRIQKSNNRPQIDRDIRKTLVFMRILDIITEMESSKTCMLSILGDGGVTVLHPNHPNYPFATFLLPQHISNASLLLT